MREQPSPRLSGLSNYSTIIVGTLFGYFLKASNLSMSKRIIHWQASLSNSDVVVADVKTEENEIIQSNQWTRKDNTSAEIMAFIRANLADLNKKAGIT